MQLFHQEIMTLLTPLLGPDITIETPPDPALGDFAVPCFPFAKTLKKSPAIIAAETVAYLTASALPNTSKPPEQETHRRPAPAPAASALAPFERITAVSGYINFFAKTEKLAPAVLTEVWKLGKRYGQGLPKKEKVMVEYSSPNTHKAFHIGHLRNAALGSALVTILRFAGYPTITANYINDTGTHVATCLWGYLNFYDGKEPAKHKGQWLGDVYADAVARLELNPALKDEVTQIHHKIEANNPDIMAAWEKTRQWSIDEFHAIYKELGISFDQWYYDHDLYEPGKSIVKDLLSNGVAKKSEGAIIVDLEPYGLGIGLVLKSDGSALYITKDLALAKEKFMHHKIDRSVYVVASEQSLHFKQLFKILDLWGFAQAKKCHHLSYELVMLAEGKMSSRAGNIVLYRDLADQVFSKAYEEVQKRHPEWPEKDILKAREHIAMAALKFGMMDQDANKVIIFDIAKALDFYGETGPYCQYAYARACSVLKKSDIKVTDKISFEAFKESHERALLKLIGAFPALVQSAAEQYRPLTIARYCLDLARTFNTFYEACPILKEDPTVKKARLLLLDSARVTLKSALALLGIEAPEQM